MAWLATETSRVAMVTTAGSSETAHATGATLETTCRSCTPSHKASYRDEPRHMGATLMCNAGMIIKTLCLVTIKTSAKAASRARTRPNTRRTRPPAKTAVTGLAHTVANSAG